MHIEPDVFAMIHLILLWKGPTDKHAITLGPIHLQFKCGIIYICNSLKLKVNKT